MLAGGGILLADTAGRVEECIVVGNDAPFGGGIYAYRGSPVVAASRIVGNAASVNGGGILLFESAATIEGSSIEGNVAGGQGGGVYAYLGSPLVADAVIVGNEAAASGGGVAWFAGDHPMGLELVLLESNLAGIAGAAAWIRSGYTNLLLSDAAICGSGASPIAGGFTEAGVVVIDAICDDCNENGVPDSWEVVAGLATDADGDGEPDECRCPGDINGDGIVDGADIGLLLVQWNTSDAAVDLNGDEVIDGADIGILLLHWGTCP